LTYRRSGLRFLCSRLKPITSSASSLLLLSFGSLNFLRIMQAPHYRSYFRNCIVTHFIGFCPQLLTFFCRFAFFLLPLFSSQGANTGRHYCALRIKQCE